jgi:hypothetical protein
LIAALRMPAASSPSPGARARTLVFVWSPHRGEQPRTMRRPLARDHAGDGGLRRVHGPPSQREPRGRLVVRDEFPGAVEAGDVHFTGIDRDAAQISIRHRPGVAVVIGLIRMTMTVGPAEIAVHSRYTHVYERAVRGWRCSLRKARRSPGPHRHAETPT